MNRQLRDHLASISVRLNEDELGVMVEIAERLLLGSVQYGPLTLNQDKRSWLKESHEEFLDAAIYLSFQTLKRRLDAKERDRNAKLDGGS